MRREAAFSGICLYAEGVGHFRCLRDFQMVSSAYSGTRSFDLETNLTQSANGPPRPPMTGVEPSYPSQMLSGVFLWCFKEIWMILKGYSRPEPTLRPGMGGPQWAVAGGGSRTRRSKADLRSGLPLGASPGPRGGPGHKYHFNIIQTPEKHHRNIPNNIGDG